MRTYFKIALLACASFIIASCGGREAEKSVNAKSNRSSQYFPNMYEDVGYSTYSEGDVFPGNVEAQKPVEGTVSRGWMPYDYNDDNEGYASAKANLKNPVPLTEEHLTNGQVLYNLYCAICHGKNGNGVGHLVETEKILGVPSYDARPLTEGSIYHVLYYGINTMGSYASQTSIEERWEITHYVEALRADLLKEERKPVQQDTLMETLTPAVNGDDASDDDDAVDGGATELSPALQDDEPADVESDANIDNN
ncbi:c-type cytochrome [Nonlabens ponticola]|uniref:Cytochrome c n=1 Tax=Nonlabens ponticola TaxID=2496866 RepID=A0A3S9MUT4_9FLAO|nr:cytochrome c [Nonlabens ponticola]AZQ42913.1 cytochrome c [Nonlabens ponticola]